MDGHDLDWARLGKHVLERREELGLTQAEVQAAGGPSSAAVRTIERVQKDGYSGRLLRGLEGALRWTEGSIDAILRGGDATPVTAAPSNGPDWNKRLAQVQAIAENPKFSRTMRQLARTQMGLIEQQIEAVLDAARHEAEQQQRGRTG